MKTYIVTIKAIGYETTTTEVQAETLQQAKSNLLPWREFATVNDISVSDARGYGFASVNLKKN